MNIPDASLPFDLALPAIDRAYALTVLLGVGLGALAAGVVLTMRPFSRRPMSRAAALIVLAALVAGCLVFGAFADRDKVSLIAAAVAAGPGALASWKAYRRTEDEPGEGTSGLLSDRDLQRDKTGSDRWVLVTGSAGSGKTALVEAMIAAAPGRLAGSSRNAEDGLLRATEVAVRDRSGGSGALRLWEARSIGGHRGRLPPLDAFDAVVLTVDPAQHAPIADSFPDALRGERTPADANDLILKLAGTMRGGHPVWAVATKADLLRFSVHPELLALPLLPGPAWRRQVGAMNVFERRQLAETLRLGQLTREHQPAFAWGRGSPLFAYSGGAGGREPLGALDLMNALLDTLWP